MVSNTLACIVCCMDFVGNMRLKIACLLFLQALLLYQYFANYIVATISIDQSGGSAFMVIYHACQEGCNVNASLRRMHILNYAC